MSTRTIQVTLRNLVNELSTASITGGTNSALVEQNHNRVKVSLAQEVSQEFYCFPECIINEKRCVSTIRGGYEERSAAVSCCIQRWQELYHSCE